MWIHCEFTVYPQLSIKYLFMVLFLSSFSLPLPCSAYREIYGKRLAGWGICCRREDWAEALWSLSSYTDPHSHYKVHFIQFHLYYNSHNPSLQRQRHSTRKTTVLSVITGLCSEISVWLLCARVEMKTWMHVQKNTTTPKNNTRYKV